MSRALILRDDTGTIDVKPSPTPKPVDPMVWGSTFYTIASARVFEPATATSVVLNCGAMHLYLQSTYQLAPGDYVELIVHRRR